MWKGTMLLVEVWYGARELLLLHFFRIVSLDLSEGTGLLFRVLGWGGGFVKLRSWKSIFP